MAVNRWLVLVAIVLVLSGAGVLAYVLSGSSRPTSSAAPASAAVASVAPRSPSSGASEPSAQPPAVGGPSETAGPSEPSTSPPAPTASASLPGQAVEMPFVPVVSFWSTERSISTEDLRATAEGRGTTYDRLIVPSEDAGTVGALLGVEVESAPMAQVEEAVSDGALAIVRVTQLTPRFRALAVDGVSLFGVDRVRDTAAWPLKSTVQSADAWDQSRSWAWVAAGDVMMDRGVALAVREHGGDGNYLFDGGTARITGLRCCPYGFPVPRAQRTGNSGAVRDLFASADLATANLESAVLVNAPYHARGFTFTADASLLDAVDDAGFDYMSLGNNHVRNAGARGIRTAAEELDARGIAHSGAGRANEAGEPGYVDANGLRIAIIGCDAIIPSWTAGPDKVGTLNCKKSDVAGRVRDARATADLVVVYPHWGREYRPAPVNYQRRLAYEWIQAGADLVIGAHSHVAGAMEEFDGHLVFYSLGNFIFDQDFRQSTMMGVVPEMTFNGTRLVQVELHATLIIDGQPNLVPAADGGQFVFDQMRDGSAGLLDY